MEFWHKKPFSIRFVHKFREFSNFEPTLDYIMLRNFGTVRPIFPKIAPKVAQDLKEKSNESSRCGIFFHEITARNVEGGGADSAPPPQSLLGLRNRLSWNLWYALSWSKRYQSTTERTSLSRKMNETHGANTKTHDTSLPTKIMFHVIEALSNCDAVTFLIALYLVKNFLCLQSFHFILCLPLPCSER